MEVLAEWGRGRAAFNGLNDRRQPIGHIQGASLTGQDMIAQRPQHHWQVVEQSFRSGVRLALAVTANQRNQSVSSGAFGVEVIKGQAMRSGISGISHGGMQSSRTVNVSEQGSLLLTPDSTKTMQ